LVALVAAAAAALLVAAGRGLEAKLETAARVDGSESAAVEAELLRRFDSPFSRSVLLVAESLPPLDGERGPAALAEIVSLVRAVPGVTRTYSYLDAREPAFVSAEATASYLLIGLDPGRPPEPIIAELRARLRDHARARGLRLELTGGPVLNVDLRAASAEQVRAAERRALPLTLGLLLVAFRAPLAALLPLLSGGLAIALSLGAAALLALWTPLSLALTSTVSMLGLGLSVDYALLTVHRFRECLAAGADAPEAARQTRRHAGKTLLLSGSAVAVGFLGLLHSPLNELRSIGVGGLLAAAFSLLLAAGLLPQVLPALGRALEWGGAALRTPDRPFWRRWALAIARRPGLTLLLCGLPLLALAAQALRYRPGLPQSDWLPASAPAVRGLQRLRAMGHGGLAQEIRVLCELPEDSPALSQQGFAAVGRLANRLASDPRVEGVHWIGNVSGQTRELAFASLVPYRVKRAFLDDEGAATVLFVTPAAGADPNDVVALVRELRAEGGRELTGLDGTRLRYGGLPALSADYADAVLGGLPRSVIFVLLGSALLLLFGLRAPVLALKAVLLNVLTVAAALGAAVVVFQDGHGSALFGIHEPLGRLFPALPALVFGSVFGLSLDYEVFLLARLREAREHVDDVSALAEALERTAGLITGAAAVMVAVFGAFTLSEFLLVKLLGFALASAVLLDATLVRLVLGPALVALAGRWNWWPARMPERALDTAGALRAT
jgi:RND superfamily putative drug exporter